MASKSFDSLIDQISNLTVLELNDLVKALEAKFGVTAAMPMASASSSAGAAGAEAAPKADEKSEFKVELVDAGDASNKVAVIKAVKAATSLGLSESKAAVENAPTVLAEAANKEDANKIKAALEAVGAKVKLS